MLIALWVVVTNMKVEPLGQFQEALLPQGVRSDDFQRFLLISTRL